MTPKEKAEELVYKFMHAECQYGFINSNKHRSKQCALIAVDEILQELEEVSKRHNITKSPFLYFEQVKQEIENL